MHAICENVLCLICFILGRVLKVDGAYAAVKFPTSSKESVKDSKENFSDDTTISLLQDCRLLRKDDLQVQ